MPRHGASELFPHERRQQIARMLGEQQRVTVTALSRHFGVSETTIRKDMTWLEAQQLIIRTHGGAVPPATGPGEQVQPMGTTTLLKHMENGINPVAHVSSREIALLDPAQARTGATTKTIGYVIHQKFFPLEVDPFYSPIMQSIGAELHQQGYHLLLSFYKDEQIQNISSFDLVADNRVDGMLLIGPHIPAQFIKQLKQLGIPMLLVDNRSLNGSVDSIQTDNRLGSRLATEHLIEHGHRTIVALLGAQEHASVIDRCQGYREAMEAAALKPHIFYTTRMSIEKGEALAHQALSAVPALTAIFAANDLMGIGAIRALTAEGKRVPEDVAVIGFDDIAWSAFNHPPLSTIRVYKQRMGQLAARRIVELVTGQGNPPLQICLATELVRRRSCGCNGW